MRVRIALAALAVFLLPAAARADEVFVAGFTNGCFLGCVPPITVHQGTGLFGLPYNSSVFSGTTAAGSLGLDGGSSATGALGVNNLGSFTLLSIPSNFNYSGAIFTLRVTFTAPQGVAGGGTARGVDPDFSVGGGAPVSTRPAGSEILRGESAAGSLRRGGEDFPARGHLAPEEVAPFPLLDVGREPV